MNEIITADYYEGQGCTCYATSANECGCEGADWTPVEVYKLREDAKQLALERDDALSQIAQAECRAERFCQERDEARTTIEDAKRALKATDYEGILLAAMRVKEERDEARDAFVIATDQMVVAQCKLREANRERDEARDALMKIEDLFIDGTDIYADREKMGTIAREALEDEK